MKDRLKTVVEKAAPNLRLGKLREFLQSVTLRTMHERHRFENMAFVGGTALRFIYDLPRFSEDLDFSLIKKEGYDPARMLAEIEGEFLLAGIDVYTKLNTKKTVHKAWLSFPKLIHEIGLTPDPGRVLSIRIDVDCNPPAGALIEKRLVNRHFPMALVYYDLPSLFAGKLGAVLTRVYVKGRDYYDLVWYLTRHKNLEPNLTLLNASLKQSGWKDASLTPETWRTVIKERLRKIDWEKIVADVGPFLEDERDLLSMTPEYVIPLMS